MPLASTLQRLMGSLRWSPGVKPGSMGGYWSLAVGLEDVRTHGPLPVPTKTASKGRQARIRASGAHMQLLWGSGREAEGELLTVNHGSPLSRAPCDVRPSHPPSESELKLNQRND